MRPLPTIFALIVGAFATTASSAATNPIAAGTVKWLTDYDQAVALSQTSGKPIFLLFQELPGCSGCRQFGQDVLSDPVTVKAIETNFVPLLIANNHPGKDAEILRRFAEPAWNFQVVRFIDAKGRDLIPRQDRVWTVEGIQKRIQDALNQVASRATVRPTAVTKRVAFAQPCFWTGEMRLGAIDGVLRTEAGFFDGQEVTLVNYDPEQISFGSLVSQAREAQVATNVYITEPTQAAEIEAAGYGPARSAKYLDANYRKAPASDQKRQLQGTSFAAVNLTPEQGTKINAFVRTSPALARKYLDRSQLPTSTP